MTKLPTVTVDAIFLSDLFFNYVSTDRERGSEDAAAEFISYYGLENQVKVIQLIQDFAERVV